MDKEVELILTKLRIVSEEEERGMYLCDKEHSKLLLDYITNLQEEIKIRDTIWESLKYYLEKLSYKGYIEEVISDDIDKKTKELESKIEIKCYQKDIKTLQEENKDLKEYQESYRKELDYWRIQFSNKKEIIDKAIDKIQYIIDYGFDYDHFNTVERLKGLIDLLLDYAKQSKNILKGENNE